MGRPKKEEPNHGKYYEVKATIVDTFGKKERKSFYSLISKADAKKQAEQYQAKKLIAEASGSPLPNQQVSFKSWAETWLKTYKKGKVKDNTYRAMYCNIVQGHLIPYFGKYSIDTIRPIEIQKFFDLKEKKNALETIKKMRTCLNAIFDTAVENGHCAKSPMTKSISISSEKKSIKKRVYSQEQYDKLVLYSSTHKNGLDIMLMLKTGITRSELLGLKWENIDFDNAIIYIQQGTVNIKSTKTEVWGTVSDGLKNDYRRRPIPIDKQLLQMLKDKPQIIFVGGDTKKGLLPVPVQTEYVIYNTRGKIFNPDKWYKNVYKPFMEAFSKANDNIPILTPHELRHTCATLWKDNGVDLFSIAKLGGWSDLEMLSKRYAHNNVESLKKALKL